MPQRYKKMFNYQRLMFNAPITPIQNSEFKIQNFARWLLAKDHVVCVKSLCNRAVSTLYSLCENGVIALRLRRNRAAIFP